MKNFEGFGLSDALGQSLARMKYTVPTPIQSQAIPVALEGKDIMGSAQTGTGKTAAFAIPIIEKLLTTSKGSALILTPTRELGKQIMEIMHQLLGPNSPIKTAFIIGGESMGKQLAQLRARPRLIVGTPGRINDHLERGNLMLHDTRFLVLDETDRMLDMGFSIQLERIFKFMSGKRQTLMFSATLPPNIVNLSQKYLNDPVRISVGATNTVAENIKQAVIRIDQSKKYKELVSQIDSRKGTIIVFMKTKHAADRTARNLRRDGYTSEALHGDLRQNKRDKVMRNFRKQNFRVLIATDIAARGLDVPHIEHVINYDLPQVAEDYIHRMGRTARAGSEGSAVSFISDQDGRKWSAIEKMLNLNTENSSNKNSKKSKSKKSYSKKPYSKNSDSKRPYSKNTKSKKSYSKKPYSKNSDSENSNLEKPYSNNSNSESSNVEKPYSKNTKAKKPYSKKPNSKNSKSKKPYSKKPNSEGSNSEQPYLKRPDKFKRHKSKNERRPSFDSKAAA